MLDRSRRLYEWKKEGAAKQPYYIRLNTDKPFAFAGLMEKWSAVTRRIESCSIITTEPNELMATIHDRMPVILEPQEYDLWLDPEFDSRDKLQSMLRPYPAQQMEAYRISPTVNNVRNQGPTASRRCEREADSSQKLDLRETLG